MKAGGQGLQTAERNIRNDRLRDRRAPAGYRHGKPASLLVARFIQIAG
jgi:hypothetical protein